VENLASTGIRSPSVLPVASRYTDYPGPHSVAAYCNVTVVRRYFSVLLNIQFVSVIHPAYYSIDVPCSYSMGKAIGA
jgi:hypothetical protein